MKKLLAVSAIMALSLSSCVITDYQFGDISRTYCGSTDPAFRVVVKGQLEALGIVVSPNYCASVNLADAMLKLTAGS